jgi:hypothetical protein
MAGLGNFGVRRHDAAFKAATRRRTPNEDQLCRLLRDVPFLPSFQRNRNPGCPNKTQDLILNMYNQGRLTDTQPLWDHVLARS